MPTNPKFPPNQKFSLAPQVLLQGFESQAILVDLDRERVYQLNATGSRIAELLDLGQPLGQILKALEDNYAASEGELARDLHNLLDELMSEGLIILRNTNHDLQSSR